MRRLIAAINMTLDGYCDHTAVDANAALHHHYAPLIEDAGLLLYGRKTYELMLYWKSVVEHPTGEQSMDEFAVTIDKIPKLVFSKTLHETGWQSATLATRPLEDEVNMLKQQPGKYMLAGSRSLIVQLIQLKLVDELQLCIHPVVAGGGLPLFDHLQRSTFKLHNTKTFEGGAVVHYYQPLYA